MEFAATLFSTGWASGVNAYGTVALLGILAALCALGMAALLQMDESTNHP